MHGQWETAWILVRHILVSQMIVAERRSSLTRLIYTSKHLPPRAGRCSSSSSGTAQMGKLRDSAAQEVSGFRQCLDTIRSVCRYGDQFLTARTVSKVSTSIISHYPTVYHSHHWFYYSTLTEIFIPSFPNIYDLRELTMSPYLRSGFEVSRVPYLLYMSPYISHGLCFI